ncbi:MULTISPECIES: hypothetical protein [Allobacillus]|uniref:Uncharacterized protein n=1 Tax=Allobacillus halotolerans TaxID=570278 RepID=A0ABS6GNS7_9BACI|nr:MULTISPECIES: hypothetical protein [Allobacillus]MBU6080728.1 hypothetical protein [Allobacillus halotolerans]
MHRVIILINDEGALINVEAFHINEEDEEINTAALQSRQQLAKDFNVTVN